ncbi:MULTISPECIES: fibronectin type III domain-containing protein [Saccharibacillus]|uniref:fibronectin type III domain-containing protein n=1 Tax=Saccharibacillus TaxID=456492 RepID=UPI00123998FA|nr:fibronectin type III domain-containing protein [Saccharibacillus sp. WB 17]MWJ32959.1 hypothetical protein [Saccharibacillus sp. WB 17]
MNNKKNAARSKSKNKAKVMLRSAVLTTGLTAQLLTGSSVAAHAEPATYEGDSFAYLSQYLGLGAAYAEPADDTLSDQPFEALGESGGDTGGGSSGTEIPEADLAWQSLTAESGDQSATLRYTKPRNFEDGRLEISGDDGMNYETVNPSNVSNLTDTSLTVTGLVNGKTYYFRFAIKSHSNVGYSNFVSATPKGTLPPTETPPPVETPPAAPAPAPTFEVPAPTTATTAPTTAPTTPAAGAEESIQVLAVSAGNLTTRSASLTRSTAEDGSSRAELRLTPQGISQASEQAARGETLAYRLPQLSGTAMQILLDGSTLAPLSSKANRLSVSTADVGITFPVERLRLSEAAQRLGVTSDQVSIRIEIEKTPVSTTPGAWTKAVGAVPVGDAYAFRMIASSGSKSTDINGYDRRYGEQTIPVPAGSDLASLGAVMLVDGKYVPIPVTFKDGQAILHTTGGNPVLLVRYDKPAESGKWFDSAVSASTTKGILEGREVAAPLDREAFARMTVRALGLESYSTNAASSLAALRSAGLYEGLPASVQSDGAITREEMIAILVNASRQFDLQLNALAPASTTAKNAFGDAGDVSEWADSYVETAYAAGLFRGDKGQIIAAQRQGTAGEAAALLVNLLRSTGLADPAGK